MYNLCTICLCQIRWYQDWIGIKRYTNPNLYVPGPWVERAHYRCWKKEQEDERTNAAAKVAPTGVGDEYSLRMEKP